MFKTGQPSNNAEKEVFYTPYDELIRSIPERDKTGLSVRTGVLTELDSDKVRARAEKLQEELSQAEFIGSNLSESRKLFLAALRNVKLGKVSVAQLASLHLLDSGIRTLYTNLMVYSIHRYLNEKKIYATTYNLFKVYNLAGMPTKLARYTYDTLVVPNDKVSVANLPWRMQKPLLQRFFNFNASEWTLFCNEMRRAPQSEQFFSVLVAPEQGCWSSMIFQLQKILKCMRVLDHLVESGNVLQEESIMLVPSLTMFQVMINVKAHTLNRKPVELVPTYGYIDSEHYAALKKSGKIAVSLYLPEKKKSLRYNELKGSFRTIVDGHPSETAFAGFLHDVYHALREMAMTENVANARIRLAEIAKNHPKNKINPEARAIDEILIDGELIHSYPPEIDTVFDPEHRSDHAQVFGEIFYTSTVRNALDVSLKEAFIEDMVVNEELWKAQFNLGRNDLLDVEQDIYDRLKTSYESIQAQLEAKIKADSHSNAKIINQLGLFANAAQSTPVVSDINKLMM